MKQFSFKYKVFALFLAIAFIGQSMSELNWHTYKPKGVSVHHETGCLVTTPNHLTYYCFEFCKP